MISEQNLLEQSCAIVSITPVCVHFILLFFHYVHFLQLDVAQAGDDFFYMPAVK